MMPKAAERSAGGGQGWGECEGILGTGLAAPPRPCWTHNKPDQGEGGGTQPEEKGPSGIDTGSPGKTLGQGDPPGLGH